MSARERDDDATLVLRFREGDDGAFSALVDRYEARSRRLAYGFLRDAQAAEDVAQDSFLQAYRRIRTLKQPSSFRSWLFSIVVNRARDELRHRSRFDEVEDLEIPLRAASDDPDEDQLVESRELRGFLRRFIGELPAKYREPLLLKEVEGMTYAEIAELLGMPMGTAQIRIHRARLRLRERLVAAGVHRASNQGTQEGG
ncbi:MAG TPA: sigma-70 family RNA polymerase sigma factor [Thermoanaerobaculia bacterium]|nr:sigma-70 family RNA polymerase sigma factor [Thermoanaerobaculia bacterium]